MNIVSEWYFSGADGAHNRFIDGKGDNPWATPLERLTICVLVMCDGGMVVGYSVCHDADTDYPCSEMEKLRARESAVANLGAQ